MKLKFIGAAREVTGSCLLLETDNGRKILIDCGLEQGPDTYENCPFPLAYDEIDCILLTHAHIDHAGRIPFFSASGFSGAVYTTGATRRLCEIMLLDSAHIQESEAEWRSRKNLRAGRPAVEPLYTVRDAEQALKLFKSYEYGDLFNPVPGVSAEFINSGHMLGSASIRLTVETDEKPLVLLFSGDIGNTDIPLICDPVYPKSADVVIMESTYGNRLHGKRQDYIPQLTEIMQRTFDRGGNLIIPSFAVGRMQELLYFIRQIKEENRVHGHGGYKVYVDSPLAVSATQVFNPSMVNYYDEETLHLLEQDINPINFPDLEVSVTAEDSKLINTDTNPKVILSTSGMCEAGRIRHHLKHNLWRGDSTILFVGYQAVNTLGRELVSGKKEVRLFDETIHVNAEICTLEGMSGHADQAGLLNWIQSMQPAPRQVFVNHGDSDVAPEFAALLQNKLGLNAIAPFNGAEYDPISGACLYAGNAEKLHKAVRPVRPEQPVAAFTVMQNSLSRLEAIAAQHKTDRSPAFTRLSEQIAALCDAWKEHNA